MIQDSECFPIKNAIQSIDGRAVVLFVLACISFSTVSIDVAWDLSGYMSQALSIIDGNGYVFIDGQPIYTRGPVFPLMIALSFKLFGASPESAFYVIRLFCVLNPLLIYLLGKRIFNADVGFAAGLLILFSYSISFWSYRHLDAVWPFFVILNCYLLYEGFEKKKALFFALAGVSLGIAYLIKEVALLFFPLSILIFLWVNEYRTIANMKYVAINLITLAITLFPWAVYLFWNDVLRSLWGAGGPVVLGDMAVEQYYNKGVLESLVQGIKQYLAAFFSFYDDTNRHTVAANFTIAPLFLLTWLFLVFSSIAGNKRFKILFLNILLFLPIIYFIGKNHWRFGQVLHTMLISYLVLSAMLYALVGWAWEIQKIQLISKRILFYVVVLTVLVVQIFTASQQDKGYLKFFENSTFHNYIKGHGEQKDYKVTGQIANIHLKKVIKHLSTLSDSNAGLMVNGKEVARMVYFETYGKQHSSVIPSVTFFYNKGNSYNVLEKKLIEEGAKALFVSSHLRPSESRFFIYMTLEEQLHKKILEENIKYIILSPLNPIYNDYFSASAKYEKVFSAGPHGRDDRAYHLYRVTDVSVQENTLPVFTNRPLWKAMGILREEHPDKYAYFKKILLSDFVNLTPEEIKSFANDKR